MSLCHGSALGEIGGAIEATSEPTSEFRNTVEVMPSGEDSDFCETIDARLAKSQWNLSHFVLYALGLSENRVYSQL